jgi:hypothetical protein
MTNHPNRSFAQDMEVHSDAEGDCYYLRVPGPGGRGTRNSRVTGGNLWCYDRAPTLAALAEAQPRYAEVIEAWRVSTNIARASNGAAPIERNMPPSAWIK